MNARENAEIWIAAAFFLFGLLIGFGSYGNGSGLTIFLFAVAIFVISSISAVIRSVLTEEKEPLTS